jgi:hypothetical protein
MAGPPQGYIDVAERIQRFYEQHPEGSLRSDWSICTPGDRVFIVCTAEAFRTPDDKVPGIGIAWEPFPGPTNFTKDSELQNAQTSAWGRAIVACGFLSKEEGIASAQDVQNRRAADEQPDWTLPAEGQLKDQAIGAVRDLAGGHAVRLAQAIKDANGGTLPRGNVAAAVAANTPDAQPTLEEEAPA